MNFKPRPKSDTRPFKESTALAYGKMVIAVGNGNSDTSSNTRRG